MKRHGAIGAAVAAVALLGAGLSYGRLQEPAQASPEYAAWTPSAAAIRSKLGAAAAPAPGMTEKERRESFCALFKSRYRDHEPAVAVGLKFLGDSRIKLMCPARLEPDCAMSCVASVAAASATAAAREAPVMNPPSIRAHYLS